MATFVSTDHGVTVQTVQVAGWVVTKGEQHWWVPATKISMLNKLAPLASLVQVHEWEALAVSAISDKLRRSIESSEAQRRQMVASVRRAYQDGRWQAATPAERARTKIHFGILRSRRAMFERELARREEAQR